MWVSFPSLFLIAFTPHCINKLYLYLTMENLKNENIVARQHRSEGTASASLETNFWPCFSFSMSSSNFRRLHSFAQSKCKPTISLEYKWSLYSTGLFVYKLRQRQTGRDWEPSKVSPSRMEEAHVGVVVISLLVLLLLLIGKRQPRPSATIHIQKKKARANSSGSIETLPKAQRTHGLTP